MNAPTHMRTVPQVILESFARTLYICTWADAREEAGHEFPAGTVIEHVAPGGFPDSALHLAHRCLGRIEGLLDKGIHAVYELTAAAPGHLKNPTAEDFGHYLAMECLGHGVAWTDDHPAHGAEDRMPLVEYELDD